MKLVKYQGYAGDQLQFAFDKVVRGMFSTAYIRKDAVLSFTSANDKEIAQSAKELNNSIHLPDFKWVGFNLRGDAKRAYTAPYYHAVKGAAKKRMNVLLDWLELITGQKLLVGITTNQVLDAYYDDEDADYEPEVRALIDLCIIATDYAGYPDSMIIDLAPNNFRMDDHGNLILLDLLFQKSEREKVTLKNKQKRENKQLR